MGPPLADALAPAQAAGAGEVEEGVQPVAFGLVEEGAELGRGPDHDGGGLLAGDAPPGHAGICPQRGLRTFARLQLYVGCRVEGDELLAEGSVQRGPQGAADALPGRRARRLPPPHNLGF